MSVRKPTHPLRGNKQAANRPRQIKALPRLSWRRDGVVDGRGNCYTISEAVEMLRLGVARTADAKLLDVFTVFCQTKEGAL